MNRKQNLNKLKKKTVSSMTLSNCKKLHNIKNKNFDSVFYWLYLMRNVQSRVVEDFRFIVDIYSGHKIIFKKVGARERCTTTIHLHLDSSHLFQYNSVSI